MYLYKGNFLVFIKGGNIYYEKTTSSYDFRWIWNSRRKR